MATSADGRPYDILWGHLDILDVPKFMEGKLVRTFRRPPFDWAQDDDDLMEVA